MGKKVTDNTQVENTLDTTQGEKISDIGHADIINKNIDRMNEMVTIQLFKDAERYKDDVFVRVGGKRYQVQRGMPVTVPRKVADVINQQLMQDQATAQMIELKEKDFERKRSTIE